MENSLKNNYLNLKKSEELIRDIPMNTFQKTRYVCGENLENLPKRTNPTPRGFFAANALRIQMVATKLAQVGFYSEVEEEQEARREVEMVHPCHKYGSTVNRAAQPELEEIEEAKRCQIRTATAVRDTSIYGDASMYSAITSHSTYVKRVSAEREEPIEPPAIPKPIAIPKKPEVTPKEKITSNTKVLGDTGSSWSSAVSGPSLATTTATLTSIVKSQGKPLRQRINENLIKNGKMSSVVLDQKGPLVTDSAGPSGTSMETPLDESQDFPTNELLKLVFKILYFITIIRHI